jgi:hypothetical protein
VTVRLACPVTPSLVATIFALPAPVAVTTPVLFTVATAVFELVHVIVRPLNTLPFASFNTAVACVVCPIVRLPEPNDTLTDATGGGGTATTATVACPVTPSLVATMFELPILTAVTTPLPFTVATAVFELLQLIARPVSTLPLASFSTAVACVVCPTPRLPVNDTVTDATDAGPAATIPTVAWPETPSLVATIVALPALTAVTTPALVTVATAVFRLLQPIVRPVSTLPLPSFKTAVACVVWPTFKLDEPNETLTDATGAGGETMTPTSADPVTPSLVAMMLALPGPSAVTRPVLFTVATAAFELLQLTVGPVNVLPLASLSTAVA